MLHEDFIIATQRIADNAIRRLQYCYMNVSLLSHVGLLTKSHKGLLIDTCRICYHVTYRFHYTWDT